MAHTEHILTAPEEFEKLVRQGLIAPLDQRGYFKKPTVLRSIQSITTDRTTDIPLDTLAGMK